MLKNAPILEIKKEERTYTLILPVNAPLGELHDVLFQMRTFVLEKVAETVNCDKAKETQEVQEPPKEGE